ncbi:MAG: efflux RND transporter periplasmic adaptor subunit [Armatimonadota bacterium]|nr:efflux RND transporter periplasmic adaptor subunit [Armatimonadota bacterium]
MRGILLLVAIATLAVVGIVWATGGIGLRRDLKEVTVVEPTVGTITEIVSTTGTVASRSAELSAKIPGRIVEVRVQEGDTVEPGMVLLRLDDRDLRSQLDQAMAALVVSRRQLEQARAAVEAARSNLARAEAAALAARAQYKQVLAGPRPEEVRAAEASVEASKARLEEAERQLQIQRKLLAEGAVGPAQVDAAKAQYDAAKAQYDAALSQLRLLQRGPRREEREVALAQVRQADAGVEAARHQLQQALAALRASEAQVAQASEAVQAARGRLQDALVTAPFRGVITRLLAEVGQVVTPGVPLLSIADLSEVWVNADIDEADLGKIRTGQRVEVTADAFPGRKFKGQITRLGRAVEIRPAARIARARIDLSGPTPLLPGMSVDVDIVVQSKEDALQIPLDALIESEGNTKVFVVSNGVVRARKIQIGLRGVDKVEVVEGLEPGELVVIGGLQNLRDGERVTIREER